MLPQHLSDELERVQKRVMRIIFPNVCYDEALEIADCKRLDKRRNAICIRTLNKIKQGPLTEYVMQARASAHQYNIRNSSDVSLYKCRIERFETSFFPCKNNCRIECHEMEDLYFNYYRYSQYILA